MKHCLLCLIYHILCNFLPLAGFFFRFDMLHSVIFNKLPNNKQRGILTRADFNLYFEAAARVISQISSHKATFWNTKLVESLKQVGGRGLIV